MSYINTLVDKVYVINLDKDVERLQNIDTALRKQGIVYERLSATVGSKLQDDPRLSDFCNRFGTDGIKGCAISHHRCWEDMLENRYSRILVFEDDAVIPDDFDEKVRNVMGRIPNDYEIILIGCRFFCKNENLLEKTVHTILNSAPEAVEDGIRKVSGSLGAHATIYTDSFVKKIIDEPIHTHIDVQIQRWISKHKIKSYGVTPEIVETMDALQHSNLSDKFPPLINKVLEKIQITNNVSAAWAFSENQFKLGPFNINIYILFFFLLAIFSPYWISGLLLAWLVIETIVARDFRTGGRYILFTGLGAALGSSKYFIKGINGRKIKRLI